MYITLLFSAMWRHVVLQLDWKRWVLLATATLAVSVLLNGFRVWPFTVLGYFIECVLVVPTAILLIEQLGVAIREEEARNLDARDDMSVLLCMLALICLLVISLVVAIVIGALAIAARA